MFDNKDNVDTVLALLFGIIAFIFVIYIGLFAARHWL